MPLKRSIFYKDCPTVTVDALCIMGYPMNNTDFFILLFFKINIE